VLQKHIHGQREISTGNGDRESECGDEVELRKIHVHSEVSIDSGESSGDGGESSVFSGRRSGSGEDVWGRRGVGVEGMV
jgi:hypothetical protein